MRDFLGWSGSGLFAQTDTTGTAPPKEDIDGSRAAGRKPNGCQDSASPVAIYGCYSGPLNGWSAFKSSAW